MSGEQIVFDPQELAPDRVELDMSDLIRKDPGPDWGDQGIEPYRAQLQAGETVVDYRLPNRMATIPLRIKGPAFDEARSAIQAKAALWQREGGWIKRVLSNGMTVYGTVVADGLKLSGGWLQAHRNLDVESELQIEMLPGWFEDWEDLSITGGDTGNGEWIGVIDGHRGDMPADVRIVVREESGQSQLGLVGHLSSRHYQDADTARTVYEAEDLTPLDLATVVTLSGASGGASNNAVRHNNLSTNWTPVLSSEIDGVGDMTHTGTRRLRARVYSTSATPPRVRAVWDVGDLVQPVENTAHRIPGANTFYLVDLGEVRLDPPPVGDHRWLFQIQAQGEAGGENVYIDKVWVEDASESRFWLATAISVDPGPAGYSARDEFNQSAGNLNGKALPLGGTWATAGDATDLAVVLDVESTESTAQRTATDDVGDTGRFARVNSLSLTAVVAQVDFKSSQVLVGGELNFAVMIRYADANNWWRARVVGGNTFNGHLLQLARRVSGTTTPFLAKWLPVASLQAGIWHRLRVMADAAGRYSVWLGRADGTLSLIASGADSALATGGSLASGSVGFYDENSSSFAITRNYDNFAAWVPDINAIVHADRQTELRSDGTFRQNAAGTGGGSTPPPYGDLPKLPPPGLEGRPAELLLKASRGDLDQLPDSGIDELSVTAQYRPTWLVVPELVGS